MIRLPETGLVLGRDQCGPSVLREDSFRDELSLAEFRISRCVQREQDRIFLGLSEDGTVRHRIHFGALAAHSSIGNEVREIAILPFLFVPASHKVAWEARYILRIGPILPLGLLSDLDSMAWALEGHWLRVTELCAFTDARLDEWFSDLALLIALDRESLGSMVGACPALGGAHEVALAEVLDWRPLAGRPLLPFEQFVRSTNLDPSFRRAGPHPSPLRVCARMGAALGLEDGRPLSRLLDLIKDRLPSRDMREGGSP